jgi:hypothetical protein
MMIDLRKDFFKFHYNFPFFDGDLRQNAGKFINILIGINHIMLYTKWPDTQPGSSVTKGFEQTDNTL